MNKERVNKILSVALVLLMVIVKLLCKDPQAPQATKVDVEGTVTVNFIDVGQGDSVLITTPNNKSMLIDTGDGKYYDKVAETLGDRTLDLVVGTHAHADHIGSMDKVVKNFKVKEVMLPTTSHTSKTYERLLLSIRDNSIKLTPAKLDSKFELDGVNFHIVSVDRDGKDLNNSSITMRMTYGNNSVLFTGDAEAVSERAMVNEYGYGLESQILHVGHHGSKTSSTPKFIEAVNPIYSVIQCGVDNKYGHPNNETVTTLQAQGGEILRTDLLGDIVFTMDGTNQPKLINNH